MSEEASHRKLHASDGEEKEERNSPVSEETGVASSLRRSARSSDAANNAPVEALIRKLQALRSPLATPQHLFWATQPVVKEDEEELVEATQSGPIDAPKTVADIRKDPYRLPSGFEWVECNVHDEDMLQQVYELLTSHYVEDDDNLFRFHYGKDFLRWALLPPGGYNDWVIGVRATKSGKLVGFITAIPTRIRVYQQLVEVAEVNFLCVHKSLRSKRLAPVLIKEVTRRVNLRNVWQAVYTAGVVLPTPVAECRYWHRSLNPKKLVEVGFTCLGERMTMSRSIKLYRVRDETATPGLRPVTKKDAPQIHALLSSYLERYAVHPEFTIREVEHWLLTREDAVYVYVRDCEGKITDLISFYILPSSVIGHSKHSEIKAAYSFYNVATSVPLKELMQDALCLAKNLNVDVFNALDIMENKEFFQDLKFAIGDGFLRYYLYNWRCPRVRIVKKERQP